MAKAPRPTADGVEADKEAVAAAQIVHEVFVKGESQGRIAIGNVPMREKLAVRQQVGMSWSDLLGQAGVQMDVVNATVIVWLTLRTNGRPSLTWLDFLSTWDDSTLGEEIGFTQIDADADDAEGVDDPQP